MNALTIEFGALCDPPSAQVRRQWPPPGKAGPLFPLDELLPFDELAQQVTALLIQGVLTDGEAHRARTRIMKKITAVVRAELGRVSTRQVDYSSCRHCGGSHPPGCCAQDGHG